MKPPKGSPTYVRIVCFIIFWSLFIGILAYPIYKCQAEICLLEVQRFGCSYTGCKNSRDVPFSSVQRLCIDGYEYVVLTNDWGISIEQSFEDSKTIAAMPAQPKKREGFLPPFYRCCKPKRLPEESGLRLWYSPRQQQANSHP